MPFTKEQRQLYDRLRVNRRSKRGVKIHPPGANRTQPFIGCDGEGAGGRWIESDALSLFDLMHETDQITTRRKWQQDYKLFRMGARYMLSEGGPLKTREILEFILQAPDTGIYIGYYFDYDVTMILRDIDEDIANQVFRQNSFNGITVWGDFAIHYLPKHKFGIGRPYYLRDGRVKIQKGTYRVIYDVGKFFQCAFVKALQQWNIVSDAELNLIQEGKDRRGKDVGDENAAVQDRDIEYNRLECEHLASLMERFRDACVLGDCVPAQWIGPGQIASTLLRAHKIPVKNDLKIQYGDRWAAAFYGGRFETSIVGRYPNAVYEHDIRSAYPAAMLKLPCLQCATQSTGYGLSDVTEYCVAEIVFHHSSGVQWGTLPIRSRDGSLSFPRSGRGIYAGPEILAAIKLGAEIEVGNVYRIEPHCDHVSFDWLPGLFNFRRSLGPTKGIALKLGLNSMYGKLVQRIGAAPYFNPVWSTLITSYVRAELLHAIAHNPKSVLMLATDAVYSTEPLPLPIGNELGQWETSTADGIFICKPGIYVAGDKKVKTRGIGASLFHEHFPHIEKRWIDACHKSVFKPPVYLFEFQLFIGSRLALQRDWALRGSWTKQEYTLDFAWSNKRKARAARHDEYVSTMPHDGHDMLRSVIYGAENLYADTRYATKRLMCEAMPDFFAFEPDREDFDR